MFHIVITTGGSCEDFMVISMRIKHVEIFVQMRFLTQVWKQSEEKLLQSKNQVKLLFKSEVCRRLKIGKKYVFSLDPAAGKLDVVSDSVRTSSKAAWQASGPALIHSSRSLLIKMEDISHKIFLVINCSLNIIVGFSIFTINLIKGEKTSSPPALCLM